MTVYSIGVADGTPNGTTLSSANTGLTLVLGNATIVASDSDPAAGTTQGLLSFTATSQTRQGVLDFGGATTQVTAVFMRKREGGTAKTATSNMFRLYSGGTTSPYAGGTIMCQVFENTNGTLRLDVESPGRTAFTSATTAPIPTGHNRFALRFAADSSGAAGTIALDVYAGPTSTTPITGLSYTSSAIAFPAAGFTSIQVLRPGGSTDVGAERWFPMRVKTGTDAGAKDTAGFTTGTPTAYTGSATVTRTTVTVSGTGTNLSLSNVTASPSVPGLTTSGMTITFTEDGTRTGPVTLAGVLNGGGGSVPFSVSVPAVAGPSANVRTGTLVRLTPTSPWV